MAWTSGFFNSVNGDRLYNAQQMSEIFNGLITDGIYESVGNKLAVQPNSGMTIQINTGRGWFGGRWVNNDAAYLLTLEAADVLLNRYCAVCVRADTTESERKAEPYLKYSSFASSPTKPTMTRTETVKEYCLAYIYIEAGATSITAANIEDTRANTSLCGWVTGLIEQVNTTTLWEQWEGQWNDFMSDAGTENDNWQSDQRSAFLSWYNGLEDYITADVETKLTNDVLHLQTDVSQAQTNITSLQNRCKKATGTLNGLVWEAQSDGAYTQTITVQGVTVNNAIVVMPTASDKSSYASMGCEATGQATNSITFTCTNPQSASVQVEVIILDV